MTLVPRGAPISAQQNAMQYCVEVRRIVRRESAPDAPRSPPAFLPKRTPLCPVIATPQRAVRHSARRVDVMHPPPANGYPPTVPRPRRWRGPHRSIRADSGRTLPLRHAQGNGPGQRRGSCRLNPAPAIAFLKNIAGTEPKRSSDGADARHAVPARRRPTVQPPPTAKTASRSRPWPLRRASLRPIAPPSAPGAAAAAGRLADGPNGQGGGSSWATPRVASFSAAARAAT